MDKPILQIKDFAGVSDNGLFYLEGASVRKVNGQSYISPSWYTSFRLSEDSTGFSGLTSPIKGFTPFTFGSKHGLIGISNGKLHYIDDSLSTEDRPSIHSISGASSYPDVIATEDNHIIWTTSQYIGIGYLFQVTSATPTSIVINGATLKATYGIDNASGTNKIYNLTKKAEYTNTKDDPTDTLEFSAPTNAPETGDWILVFIDQKWDLGIDNSAQVRQIVSYDLNYFITNGNYLASISGDLATFNATAKQLPTNTYATCMAVNQSRLLVGASLLGKGRILLWDGIDFGYGWTNIKETDKPPTSIKAYKDYWAVLVGARILYTDGYTLKRYDNFFDNDEFNNSIDTIFNGMLVLDDKIFIVCQNYTGLRFNSGVFIYDSENGWSYAPFNNSDGLTLRASEIGAIYYYQRSGSASSIYLSFSDSETDKVHCVNTLSETNAGEYSLMYFLKLPQKIQINRIELNISPKIKKINSGDTTSKTITVNFGDGRYFLFNSGSVKDTSSATVLQNSDGFSRPAIAGQLIRVLNGKAGGERAYIQTIANGGESDESWTISPALSFAPDSGNTLIRYNLKESRTQTIEAHEIIPDTLDFNVTDFQSDKLFIEIIVNGAIDIHEINIY